jgi:bla regulator protein BlaR1
VVGLMRSRIVVPAWVMQESPDQQHYVMAHEQSHLDARDPLLVALSLILLMAMPWNPLLWWQFHRLRCAIEVDCDARVLQAGGDIGDYCETLIQVGQNQSEFIGSVTAMSESRTFLEQRIRIMLSKPKKWAGAFAFVLISIALGMAVFAAQVTPPATSVPTVSNAISVNPALLDTYVGDYEISDTSMITVRRKGDGLAVSPIGQLAAAGTIDAPAISATQFSVPPVDATLDFVNGTNHQVSSMIVRVHGVLYVNAPRVDAARAAYIRDALSARVRNQTPYPDSENVLRRAVDPDNTTGIRPEAQMNDLQRTSLKAYFAKLGPVQSYRFNGVTGYGWDSYDVQHQNGAEQVFFLVDERGLIVSSVVRRQ